MISVGKAIYTILSDNSIKALVSGRVFPVVAPQDTQAPFIVYTRSGKREVSKDGTLYYYTTVEISIITKDYKQGIQIAEAVDAKMKEGEYSGIQVIDVLLNSVTEEVSEDEFVQVLQYLVITI